MADSNTFIMYKDMAMDIDGLSLEQKGMLFDAVFDFQNGNKPEIPDPFAAAVFRVWTRFFKRDAEAWEKKRQKRRDAANKRWSNQPKDDVQMNANASDASVCNASDAINVNGNVNVNVNKENILKESANASDDDKKAVINFYLNNVSSDINRTQADSIIAFVQDMGGDLVIKAMEEALMNGVRKWAYIKTVLSKYKSNGIRTVEDLENYRRRCSNGAEMRTETAYSTVALPGEQIL